MPNADLTTPGLTLCHRCRREPATVILSEPGYERHPEPLCFTCVENMIERENAWSIDPIAVGLIDVATDALDRRDADPHIRRQIARLSEPQAAKLARRCIAIRPDGTRCVRDATIPGRYTAKLLACDLHRTGAKSPGLGWTPDGQPRGNPVTLAT